MVLEGISCRESLVNKTDLLPRRILGHLAFECESTFVVFPSLTVPARDLPQLAVAHDSR